MRYCQKPSCQLILQADKSLTVLFLRSLLVEILSFEERWCESQVLRAFYTNSFNFVPETGKLNIRSSEIPRPSNKLVILLKLIQVAMQYYVYKFPRLIPADVLMKQKSPDEKPPTADSIAN